MTRIPGATARPAIPARPAAKGRPARRTVNITPPSDSAAS
jgi:hypothetical protein